MKGRRRDWKRDRRAQYNSRLDLFCRVRVDKDGDKRPRELERAGYPYVNLVPVWDRIMDPEYGTDAIEGICYRVFVAPNGAKTIWFTWGRVFFLDEQGKQTFLLLFG